ncbi:Kelch domain-containing protein 10 [Hypsibius exemplaris]|uniref:Kelch domain-containing protein 10 n=1 Tax=Hypsibius exemplaris TaxID=2072580 RepID=A0A1W0XE89_HYPEX|nr:Kelch domain-containing protein 10 [Hypsibius exemplaris]
MKTSRYSSNSTVFYFTAGMAVRNNMFRGRSPALAGRSGGDERQSGSRGGARNYQSIFACVLADLKLKNSEKPQPRSGHRIAADEGNLYSFGGYNPAGRQREGSLYRELWKFNLATKRWTLLKHGDSCPEETASHSMLLMGSSLLVAFGTGFPFGEKCSNQLHVYHIPSAKWQTVTCGGDMPSPRYGQSMTLKDGSVFVMGGTTGFNYNMKVYRLNFETLHWEDTSPSTSVFPGQDGDETPAPRYRHEVATSGNWLYVLGGGTAQICFNFEVVPSYNTQTKKWANMTAQPCPRTGQFPPARKFHAAVQHANFAYMFGGFDGDAIMFNDIWRLDLSNLQWTKMWQTLPQEIYFHTATTTPAGCMYVFGGVTTANGATRSNHVFKMWLTMPTLQELVWDRICEKHPKLLANLETPANRAAMRAQGIMLPRLFYSRLD